MRGGGKEGLRILIDNSALRVFALHDPSARATNRLLRIHRAVPLLTPFTVEEVLHGLLTNPGSEEIQARCRFILSLERLWVLPTRIETIWFEYTKQTAITRQSGPFGSTPLTLEMLRRGAVGDLPPHVAAEGKSHYLSLAEGWENARAHVLSGSSVEDFRIVPYEEVSSPPELAGTAEKVIKEIAATLKKPLHVGLMLGACMNAARSNGRAPHLAGEIRVHAWSNWHLARQGNVRGAFREDLKLLVWALCADVVLTRDADYFKHGPTIFPEVKFLNPDSFLKPL